MSDIERWQYRRELGRRDFSSAGAEMRRARLEALRQANGRDLFGLAGAHLVAVDQLERRLVAEAPGIAWELRQLRDIYVCGMAKGLAGYLEVT